MLDCKSDVFVIMHGTNDIVHGYGITQIVESIMDSVFYVKRHNPKAAICFVPCLHVNGRADRSNKKIDEMNMALKAAMEGSGVLWIDVAALDDDFGNLRQEYSYDGLHLSAEGYEVFRELLEQGIEELLK